MNHHSADRNTVRSTDALLTSFAASDFLFGRLLLHPGRNQRAQKTKKTQLTVKYFIFTAANPGTRGERRVIKS